MVKSKFVAVERWDEHARKVHYKKETNIGKRELPYRRNQPSHVRSTRCVLVLRNKIFERIFLTLFLKKFFSVLYLYVLFALSNIPVFQHRTIRKWCIKGLCN